MKSPVRENRSPGSVRGAPGDRRPYRDRRNPSVTAGTGPMLELRTGKFFLAPEYVCLVYSQKMSIPLCTNSSSAKSKNSGQPSKVLWPRSKSPAFDPTAAPALKASSIPLSCSLSLITKSNTPCMSPPNGRLSSTRLCAMARPSSNCSSKWDPNSCASTAKHAMPNQSPIRLKKSYETRFQSLSAVPAKTVAH